MTKGFDKFMDGLSEVKQLPIDDRTVSPHASSMARERLRALVLDDAPTPELQALRDRHVAAMMAAMAKPEKEAKR